MAVTVKAKIMGTNDVKYITLQEEWDFLELQRQVLARAKWHIASVRPNLRNHCRQP
jgi:hypothetical protein